MCRAMSPLAKVEADVFTGIAASLRRWADALDAHRVKAGTRDLGPAWQEVDLLELYETWVAVGYAIRDVARTRPRAGATAPRTQLVTIRDGLARIADVAERQA